MQSWIVILVLVVLQFVGLKASGVLSAEDDSNTLHKIVLDQKKYPLATCNDLTPAIMYFRPAAENTDSATWVVMLEGGWYCSSNQTCQDRWVESPFLMSSANAPDTKDGGKLGLFDANYTAGVNVVFVPYVSSDTWMGNSTKNGFHFRGREILDAVLETLVSGFNNTGGDGVHYSMKDAKTFLFTGGSAGGGGALYNSWHVKKKLEGMVPDVTFKSLPDSGFFAGLLDDPMRPEGKASCKESVLTCYYGDGMDVGFNYWEAKPLLDPVCKQAMRAANVSLSHCLYADEYIQYVDFDIFMIMYIFDAAEYTMDGITDPTDAEQIGFINELQHAKREIFSQRPGFYPACFGHVITESDPSVLTSLQIDGVSVWDAILNWFKTGSNASYMDSCTEAQCNPSCPAV